MNIEDPTKMRQIKSAKTTDIDKSQMIQIGLQYHVSINSDQVDLTRRLDVGQCLSRRLQYDTQFKKTARTIVLIFFGDILHGAQAAHSFGWLAMLILLFLCHRLLTLWSLLISLRLR